MGIMMIRTFSGHMGGQMGRTAFWMGPWAQAPAKL